MPALLDVFVLLKKSCLVDALSDFFMYGLLFAKVLFRGWYVINHTMHHTCLKLRFRIVLHGV